MRHGIDVARLRQNFSQPGQKEQMESDILEDKVLNLLIGQAEIEEVEEVSEA